jgi:hypothetical protein
VALRCAQCSPPGIEQHATPLSQHQFTIRGRFAWQL